MGLRNWGSESFDSATTCEWAKNQKEDRAHSSHSAYTRQEGVWIVHGKFVCCHSTFSNGFQMNLIVSFDLWKLVHL